MKARSFAASLSSRVATPPTLLDLVERYGVESGQHVLAVSISPFDPDSDIRVAENLVAVLITSIVTNRDLTRHRDNSRFAAPYRNATAAAASATTTMRAISGHSKACS